MYTFKDVVVVKEETHNFVQQGRIELIKSNSKDVYNVT